MLDSTAGGTFMGLTLGAATRLLDNIMVNYSEWHVERAPLGKKVNSIEETSALSEKIDVIMAMLVNGKAPLDPNNVPLASLVSQEEQVDVNFIRNNNFNNNAYRNNFILVVTTIIGLILLIMAIPMETPTTILEVLPLNLKSCSKTLLVNKSLSTRLWRKSF